MISLTMATDRQSYGGLTNVNQPMLGFVGSSLTTGWERLGLGDKLDNC